MAAPRILFVSLTDDIGTDRIVADLGRAGAACAVLGPTDSYAMLVRCVAARFTMPRRRFRAAFVLRGALADAIAAWRPEQVVPLDDFAATLLRSLATSLRVSSAVRGLLQASFGAPAGYEAACQRVVLAQLAQQTGVRTPAFAAASGAEAAERIAGDLGFPVMVKRDQSSGSGGVVRVETRAQLAIALRFAQLKTVAKTAITRFARIGRPLTPIIVQQCVDGGLAMYTAVCRDGRMIDGVGMAALATHPVKHSSTILGHLPHPELENAARKLVAALGCSGFVSFDFIVDPQGRAFLIEMNPRPIGSVHLGRLFGHDLAHAFLTGSRATSSSTSPPRDLTVALFPKELERDPLGQSLIGEAAALHDVPEHEPAVVAAYLRHLKAEHPAYAAAFDRLLPNRQAAVPVSAPASARPTPC